MSKNLKTIAIVPAFNEEGTIGDVTRDLLRYVSQVIVVDDGSVDKTSGNAGDAGALVIRHTVNKGYDKSLEEGFKLANDLGADIFITFDADGQHVTSDIPTLLSPILNGEADIVVGKRPKHARFAEWVFHIYSKIKLGISDPLCGFKVYRDAVYKKIGYFDRSGSIGTELIFNAQKNGFKVIERPIRLNNRKDGFRFMSGKRLEANWAEFKTFFKIFSKFR